MIQGQEFRLGDGFLTLVKNPWDSLAFGRSCWDLYWKTLPVDPADVRGQFAEILRQLGVEILTCRTVAMDRLDHRVLQGLGFFYAETQLSFRIRFSQLPKERIAALDIRKLEPEDWEQADRILQESFKVTRFDALQSIGSEQVGARFRNWGHQLAGQDPDLALVAMSSDGVQGIFLSRRTERAKDINLTLAAILPGDIPGSFFFRECLAVYRDMGFTSGHAVLTAANLGSLNAYAQLGARFLEARDFFFLER